MVVWFLVLNKDAAGGFGHYIIMIFMYKTFAMYIVLDITIAGLLLPAHSKVRFNCTFL